MSLPWEFYDHFSFFAEIYSLEHAESKKNFVTNFFKVGDVIFYVNELWRHELAIVWL